jgi:putative copper resistance protein D
VSDIGPLAVARALHIAATVALAGAFAFRFLVLPRPKAGPVDAVGSRDAPAAVAARWQSTWCSTALVVAVASWLGWLALTAASMSGTGVAEAIDPDVLGTVLARTTFGQLWVMRSACLLALAACLVVARRGDGARATTAEALAACLALLLLLTIAGTGHAVAGEPAQRFARLSIDALHLLGAGAWLGALVPLLFVLGRAGATPAPAWHVLAGVAVRRFSVLGVFAVALLLGSGLSNAVWLVGSWDALGATSYGRLVEAKVALFAVILAIAAVNRVHLTPRLELASAHDGALRALRRNAIAELAIGAAVVCVVGALGVTPPPAHEHAPGMRTMSSQAGGDEGGRTRLEPHSR